MGFDFDIEYKTGPSNTAADSLSRRDVDAKVAAITLPCWINWDNLRREVAEDVDYALIIQALMNGEAVDRPFILIHGILYYKDRLTIPAKSPWVTHFLNEFHSNPVGGHTVRSGF